MKKLLTSICTITISLLTVTTVYAQSHPSFEEKQLFCKQNIGIELYQVEDFATDTTDFNIFCVGKAKENLSRPGSVYWIRATAFGNNTVLLYPTMDIMLPGMAESISHYNKKQDLLITDELALATLGGVPIHKNACWQPDWGKHVTIHAHDDYAKTFNADTVFVVDFPSDCSEFDKNGKHCIGFYLKKEGRYSTNFKLLLTDEGYQHRQEWIDRMKGCIKFSHIPSLKEGRQIEENFRKISKSSR